MIVENRLYSNATGEQTSIESGKYSQYFLTVVGKGYWKREHCFFA